MMTKLQNTLRQIRLFEKMRAAAGRKRTPLRVSRLAEGEGEAALMLRTLALRSLSSPRRFRV